MQSSITFVSAFFNIGRVANHPLLKYDNYFNWINQLLKTPINLYFITTADIHDRLQYEPRNTLKFHIVTEDKIPFFDKLPLITQCWEKYRTNNKEKDTAKFACLTHAKFHCVQQAIANNPFDSTHYAWIDAGIFKIAKGTEELLQLTAPDKIRLLILNYIDNNETKHHNFVLTCRYKIAGGFFVGPKVLMIKFIDAMITEVEASLTQNIFGLEQEYMALVYKKHPELFEPYYGDFCDLITNYHACCNTAWLIMQYLIKALENNDIGEAKKVAKYLIDSPNYNGDKRTLLDIVNK
jgi:hypothetical protein